MTDEIKEALEEVDKELNNPETDLETGFELEQYKNDLLTLRSTSNEK